MIDEATNFEFKEANGTLTWISDLSIGTNDFYLMLDTIIRLEVLLDD